MQELKAALKDACQKLFNTDVEPELSRPSEQFGDFATNAALQLGKQLGKNPREIAIALASQMHGIDGVADVQIAGPGFINLKLTDEKLAQMALGATELGKPLEGQEILAEFGDPNPFKEMHIGHLYSYINGDTIASLLETQGAQVKRLSYHGDVGLHVAKTIWAIQRQGEGDVEIGQLYAQGAKAYEQDDSAKEQILEINKHIYAADDPLINGVYEDGKRASFEAFDKILDLLSISTDKRYLESQTAGKGMETVKQNTPQVFQESQGAIIYDGEKSGLHTRVFITSQGLPTYETKDLGLAELKDQDFPDASRSIIITANEQTEYFKVMLAALAEIKPELAQKTTHLSHGFLTLSSGKMSSRSGDVYGAWNLLMEVKDAVHKQYPDSPAKKVMTFAAVKYAFLKHRLGGDIVFDVEESISLEGNSGPYLQYAHARACSILSKAKDGHAPKKIELDENERALAAKIGEYPEVIGQAATELMPHHVCTYLYELAQAFNRFYESSRIIGSEREAIRLQLTKAYQQVLKSGLDVLNIVAPEQM